MDKFDREEIRTLVIWAWVMFVLLLGLEAQRTSPLPILKPLVAAAFGAPGAQEFFSHVSNFTGSFMLVYLGGLTLTWPKLWWVWIAVLAATFAFHLSSGLPPQVSFFAMMSFAMLPLLLAIGEILKRIWPQVGIPTIWSVASLIIYNGIIELIPGAYANYGDPIDFLFGIAGSFATLLTFYVMAKTE